MIPFLSEDFLLTTPTAKSIPLALVEGVEQGKVKLGSTAILTGFGAGMTWGGAIVRLREGIC